MQDQTNHQEIKQDLEDAVERVKEREAKRRGDKIPDDPTLSELRDIILDKLKVPGKNGNDVFER